MWWREYNFEKANHKFCRPVLQGVGSLMTTIFKKENICKAFNNNIYTFLCIGRYISEIKDNRLRI